ncbi:MAG: transglutaminase family protein [Ostreibacterium sp.]
MFLSVLRKLDLPRAEDLSSRHLYHLIVAYLLIALPIVLQFPWWIAVLIGLVAGLKIIAIRQHWQLSKWLLLPFGVACFMLIAMNTKSIGITYSGVALLLIFSALKLLEAKESRDAFILMLAYLLLILGGLMADEGIVNFIYLILCFFYNIYIQLRIAQPPEVPISLKQNVKMLVKILLICLPFVVGLFFLFPRIDPLWSQPSPPQSTTGLSDEMTPNSLSELSQSGDLAFRVKFNDGLPSNRLLYWRGPVLVDFDGKTWRRDKNNFQQTKPIKVVGNTRISYTTYHDGTTGIWLLPLDLPSQLAKNTRINNYYEMVSAAAITKPTAFKIVSHTQYLTPKISPVMRQRLSSLPANIFPKTRQLAKQLREKSRNTADFAQKVLDYFSQNPFYYDLSPPVGNADMDKFLFENRIGYCEHYASSFTFMMRSQGVPARVVTGYQGGQKNPVSGEVEVRQYNAHAWSEIYLDGKGWVRIDPTAAVAPERVNSGSPFGSARNTNNISAGARWEVQSEFIRYFSTRLRAMSAFWQNWIINYNNDLQNTLWEKLGLSGIKDIAWILFILILLPIIIIVVWWYRRRQSKSQGDAIWQVMQPFVRQLNKMGLDKPSGMPWRVFITETKELGDKQKSAEQVVDYYYRLRYYEVMLNREEISHLKKAIEAFIKDVRQSL